MISVIILAAFAQMYFINDRGREFKSFGRAFLRTYSMFLAFEGRFEETEDVTLEMKISFLFGFLVVVLLLNIVIAVVNTAWDNMVEQGRDNFLLYRIRLLLEVRDLLEPETESEGTQGKRRGFCNKGICSLFPDGNYNKMWGESKNFAAVLRRIKMNTKGLALIGRFFLYILYLVLGIIFGLMWPKAIRRKLFCIDNTEAIANKRNRLDGVLRETQKELERLW